jgi:hypothetical protein
MYSGLQLSIIKGVPLQFVILRSYRLFCDTVTPISYVICIRKFTSKVQAST